MIPKLKMFYHFQVITGVKTVLYIVIIIIYLTANGLSLGDSGYNACI
jgi:Fe2+ transport system protein B